MSILKYRIFGIRVFDTVLTILVLWIIGFLIQTHRGKLPSQTAMWQSFLLAVILTFPFAILAHTIVNKPTFLNCKLSLSSNCPESFE
jgi:peptidoglycan/LPS O-acetylase OafA/YrhL